jgi:hypothetical protein
MDLYTAPDFTMQFAHTTSKNQTQRANGYGQTSEPSNISFDQAAEFTTAPFPNQREKGKTKPEADYE